MTNKHSPGFLKVTAAARKHIREVSLAEVKKWLEASRGDFVLLDVREDSEWNDGHLPGAEHLGRGVLERDIEKRVPDLNTEIILYCGGGFRSALAADSLMVMGYKRVASMWGGFGGWQEAGYDVVRPTKARP